MESKRRSRLRTLAAPMFALVLASAVASADELQTRFDDAVQAIEADNLRTARETLTAILNGNPSLHRARLELARAYYLSQDYAEARKQAQQVLDDPNTPPSVRTTVLAFLAQIAEDEKRAGQRHQWTPSLYAGLMYDTNVNVGPSRDVIDIGGNPFVVSPDSRERGDMALVLNPGISHTFNPGRRIEVGEHSGNFLWQSQASGYYRPYFDEDDFNLGILTLRTGPVWVVPRHWRAGVGLQGDQIWLGGDSLAFFTTLNPNITWEFAPATEVALDAALARRHYWQNDDDGRDGWYQSATIAIAHYLDNGNVSLQGGVGYSDFSADDDRFGYHGPEVFAGVTAAAWTNGVVYARAAYRKFDFDGIEPFFGSHRDDDEWRYTLGFEHDFRSGALRGWALQGSWIHTRNQSNLALYDYDRDQYNLGLARGF